MARKKQVIVPPAPVPAPVPVPTTKLPPESPPRRPVRGTIDDVIARIGRRDTYDQTVANNAATALYSTSESFPLLSFMEAWKADKLEAPTWFVLAVIKAYGLLVQRHGGKPGE